MRRDPGMERRLDNWQRWATSNTGPLGYARRSTFVRLAPASAPTGERQTVVPINEVEAAKTDDAVASLSTTHRELYQLLKMHYIKGKDLADCGRHFAKTRETMRAWLGRADALLAEWLAADSKKKRGL